MCCFSLKNSRLWFTLPIENGIKKSGHLAISTLVIPAGFKPTTPTSVVWCSIQLSHGTKAFLFLKRDAKVQHFPILTKLFATFFK